MGEENTTYEISWTGVTLRLQVPTTPTTSSQTYYLTILHRGIARATLMMKTTSMTSLWAQVNLVIIP